MRQPGWYHTAGARHTGGRYIAPAHWVGYPDEDGSHALCGAQPHMDYFGKHVTPESWKAEGMLGEVRYCLHCQKAMETAPNIFRPSIVWHNGADATRFLTQDQINAVNRLGLRYENLREEVRVMSGMYGVIYVQAGGITLGIERDGYTHS